MAKVIEFDQMTDVELLEIALTAGERATVALLILQGRRQDASAKRIEELTNTMKVWTIVVAIATVVSLVFIVLSALKVFG
jgi:hypothetical protein